MPGATSPCVQITGTGVTFTIAGQTLSADVTITAGNDPHGQPAALITLANLTAGFGGTASAPVLTVTQNGVGAIDFTSAGVAGSISVNVALGGVSGFSLTGMFGIAINTTSAAQSIAVGATTINLPAGPYLQISATQASVSVLGQVITADVTVTSTTDGTGARVVSLALANGSITLGGGAVSLSAITGAVLVTRSGVAGSLSATIAIAAGDGISLGGTFSLQVNTTSAAVNDSFPVGAGSVSLLLPAGPYFQLQAQNATVSVGGQTLSGTITITQSTLPVLADPTLTNGQAPDPTNATGVPALQIAIANGSVQLGDGTTNLVSVTNIAGTLIVFDAATAMQSVGGTTTVSLSGVVAKVSGTVAVQGIPGVAFSANATVIVNTTGHYVDALVSQGGTAAPQTWAATPTFAVSATQVSLTFAGQTLTGDISLSSGNGVVTAQFANASVSFGGGIIQLSGGTARCRSLAAGPRPPASTAPCRATSSSTSRT